MRKLSLIVIAAIVTSCSVLFFFHSSPLPRPAPAPLEEDVNDIAFYSQSLEREMRYRVILPGNYKQGSTRHTVLYLLHGRNGDRTDWQRNTRITDYASPMSWIVVMPDADDGYYTNAAGTPKDRYEDYIVKDLTAEIEQRFRVKPTREGRLLAGISMGGYGAVTIGFRHPELYAAVGALSSPMNITHRKFDLRHFRNSYFLRKIFGPDGGAFRDVHDPFALARRATQSRVQLPYFYLACGSGDPNLEINRQFDKTLGAASINHEFNAGAGGHDWKYWDSELKAMLPSVAKHLH